MNAASGLRGAARLAALAVVACASPPVPAPEAVVRLEQAARVERVRFHGAADLAPAARARALLEERLGAVAEGAEARPLALDLQLARVAVRRRPRVAGVASAWLGGAAWRVESRLFGRLRVRDAAGCLLAEVQARRDYRARAGWRGPVPLPGEGDLRALVDRLVALARQRLDVSGASGRSGRPPPCPRRAARGILAASRPP